MVRDFVVRQGSSKPQRDLDQRMEVGVKRHLCPTGEPFLTSPLYFPLPPRPDPGRWHWGPFFSPVPRRQRLSRQITESKTKLLKVIAGGNLAGELAAYRSRFP